MMFASWALFGLLGLSCSANEASHRYGAGERLLVWADRTGPYEAPRETYAFEDLPLCDLWGVKDLVRKSLSLGEAIQGKRATLTPRIIINWPSGNDTSQDTEPQEICRMRLSKDLIRSLTQLVNESYWVSYEIDGLPAYTFIGEKVEDVPMVFAHRNFIIQRNGDQVIAVAIIPSAPVSLKENGDLRLTYSARFVDTDVPFSQRMSLFYQNNFFEWKLQWFSLGVSALATMMLLLLVSAILRRAIKADLATDLSDDAKLFDRLDDAGWTIIGREIFRRPKHLQIHSIVMGTGVHLVMAALLGATLGLVLALMGHAVTLEFAIIVYTVTQPFNGLVTAFFYSQGNGNHLISACIWSLLAFPLCSLLLFLQLNTAYTAYGTTTALTMGRIIGSVCLFGLINLPLHVTGCYYGKRTSLQVVAPVKATTLERPIPKKAWWIRPGLAILSGAMPFACLFVETFFIFDAMWSQRTRFVYGFLLIALALYVLSVACATITAVYLLLNAEDHRWQWFSMQCGGSAALYMLVYAMAFNGRMVSSSSFLHKCAYWACTAMVTGGVGLGSAAIGHASAYFFVHRMYRSVKSE